MARILELSSLNLASLSQRLARLDHYYQARFRNRFGPTVKALTPFITPGGLILDIGANHGKFARHFACIHNGSCRVWCFEPLEYNHTLLAKVVAGKSNVRIFTLALSDKSGTADFYVPLRPSRRISPGSAHLGREEGSKHFGTSTSHDVGRVTVQTDTLDELVAREKPTSVDFIKIDVEGAEALVFRGGRDTLARFKPPVYCEITTGRPLMVGETAEGTVSQLTALGYRIFGLPEKATKPLPIPAFTPDIRDYLFLHPDRHPM